MICNHTLTAGFSFYWHCGLLNGWEMRAVLSVTRGNIPFFWGANFEMGDVLDRSRLSTRFYTSGHYLSNATVLRWGLTLNHNASSDDLCDN